MRINHNISAFNTYRQLSINNGETAKSLEKLSSGYRINRAGDDAAGLAISEKMRGQIRGLDQASRNSQDGISLIQTAEGALNETHSILQRMRELAVQSSNDTYTSEDRAKLNAESEQLKAELNRISTTTEFNTKKLLDGSIGQITTMTTNNAQFINVGTIDGAIEGTNTITTANVAIKLVNVVAAGGVGDAAGELTLAAPAAAANGLEAGKYTVDISGAVGTANITLKDAQGNVLSQLTGVDTTAAQNLQIGGQTVLTVGANAYNGTDGTIKLDVDIASDLTIAYSNGTSKTYTGIHANEASVISAGGFDIDVTTGMVTAQTTTVNVQNNGIYFQIGANQGQTARLGINSNNCVDLKIDSINITTQGGAEQAITLVNNALERVSNERSKLGAMQNRLEHTIKNLDTASENLTASESRIRDVDMAKEMMEYTKNNILTQAAQAMLAQANQQPQGVLQLLR